MRIINTLLMALASFAVFFAGSVAFGQREPTPVASFTPVVNRATPLTIDSTDMVYWAYADASL